MRNLPALLFLVLLAACGQPSTPTLPSNAADVSWRYQHAVDFKLNDASGKPRTLAEFRDKVVVLFFGYTHCPEVCPTTLADLAQAMKQLGPDAARVQVLFVTLDPERDTPEVLAKYVPSFHASFLGLYGDAAATAQAAKAFAVTYEKHELKSGYAVDHTDAAFLIGNHGRSVLMSPYGQRTELLVQDIRLLLAASR